MLASPTGPSTLAEIESITKQGHGLYRIDGTAEGVEHLIVGVVASGFFPAWMKFMNLSVDDIPNRNARRYEELGKLPVSSWITVERLFARIPKLSDLFNSTFDDPQG